MLDSIDKDSAHPLYQQIKQVICGKISSGDWRPGMRIPSENELVEIFGVSRMTVHRALRDLTREGVLHRVHGRGTYVSRPQRHASLIRLKDIAEEIREKGSQHSSRVLAHLKIRTSSGIARKMECAESGDVFYLEAVHFQDDKPIQHEQRYINPNMVPGFMHENFEQQTATRYLVELYRPDEMEHIVQAIMPGAKTRELLELGTRQPCLRLSRRTWINGSVVTYVTMTYPGDRYQLAARYATTEYQTVNV